jgi:hypothetical protein
MREDELAALAADNMLFPGIPLLEGERRVVIRSEDFRIGTRFGGYAARGLSIPTGRAQMAGERFFKGSVAIVMRHSILLS